MRIHLCLAALALAAGVGCNENRLSSGAKAPPAADDDDDDGGAGARPVAVILASGAGGATSFDGSSSYDPDDTAPDAIAAFTWALVSVPAGSAATLAGNGATATLATDVPGSYVLSLVVQDREGLLSDPATYSLAFLEISIDGDCLTASCPAEAPYPVGCDIDMDGGDERGCVASTPASSVVYFQEGDACGAGHVSGKLLCAGQPGLALGEATCPMNKSVRFYPAAPSGCPATN